jgi:hypothetical protein
MRLGNGYSTRRLFVFNVALIAIVGMLIIRQCCIPSAPQPSHSQPCPHDSNGQKPSGCEITDQAVVDRSAGLVNAAADIDPSTFALNSGAEPLDAPGLRTVVFDLGPPNLFLQNSTLRI